MELKSIGIYKVIESHQYDGLCVFKIDQNNFHIQGGGQPNDILYDGYKNKLKILFSRETGEISLESKVIQEKNSEIELYIDAEYRQLCSKLHSSGHLIALIGEKFFNLSPIKAKHFPEESYVTFEMTDHSADIENVGDDLSKIFYQYIKNDTRIYIEYLNNVRISVIEGLGSYACGGTHVYNTLHLKDMIIKNIKKKKNRITVIYGDK